MTVTKTLDFMKKPLTEEKLEMLKALDDREITFDEDSPELTEEELARAYRPDTLRTDNTESPRRLGIAKGRLTIPDNFDDTDEELVKMMMEGNQFCNELV